MYLLIASCERNCFGCLNFYHLKFEISDPKTYGIEDYYLWLDESYSGDKVTLSDIRKEAGIPENINKESYNEL